MNSKNFKDSSHNLLHASLFNNIINNTLNSTSNNTSGSSGNNNNNNNNDDDNNNNSSRFEYCPNTPPSSQYNGVEIIDLSSPSPLSTQILVQTFTPPLPAIIPLTPLSATYSSSSSSFSSTDDNEVVVSEDVGGTEVMNYDNVDYVDDNDYNDDRVSSALENNVDNLEVVLIDVTSFVNNNDDEIEGIDASRVDGNNDHINIIQNDNNDYGGEGILASQADDNYQINIMQNDNDNVVHEIDLIEDNNQFVENIDDDDHDINHVQDIDHSSNIIVIDDDDDDDNGNNNYDNHNDDEVIDITTPIISRESTLYCLLHSPTQIQQPILQPEIIIIDDDDDDEKDNNTNASAVAVEGDTESLQIKCTICLDYPKNVSATSCGHIFCYECIVTAVRTQKMCSICRKPLSLRQIKKLEFKTLQQ